MNILITGGGGYIGTGLYNHLSSTYNVISINRQTFDLRNYDQTKTWFQNKFFDIVIHTSIVGGNRLINENGETIYSNLLMFDNLLDFKNHFNKLITFGSGAEFYNSKSPYGLSKKIINYLCHNYTNFYNLRLYGLFDENENERRFIKSNINKYINHQNMLIHNNKYMDFIFFKDFLKIIEFYIKNTNPPKEIDCVYKNKYTLLDIANIINSLNNYYVNIDINHNNDNINYTGNYLDLNIEYIGLESGIKNTYRKLKDEKDMVCSK